MPVGTYIIATEPLGPERALKLLPHNVCVSDTNFVLDYFRLSADWRMLFGGRVSYSTIPPAGLARRMRQRMLAVFPSIICYWYRFSHDNLRIDTETDDDSIGGHFLHMLRGGKPNALHERVMNVSLILYAEHEFNASTFTSRVVAGTGSDMFSAVAAGVGALYGPLHGGANEAAMEMIERWQSADEAERERANRALAHLYKLVQRGDELIGGGAK